MVLELFCNQSFDAKSKESLRVEVSEPGAVATGFAGTEAPRAKEARNSPLRLKATRSLPLPVLIPSTIVSCLAGLSTFGVERLCTKVSLGVQPERLAAAPCGNACLTEDDFDWPGGCASSF
jgi:hypothetical protein